LNLRPRRRHSQDVNLTPLIDVVFLLLIFFMVSTTFEKQTRIEVELPTAETVAEQPEEPEKLEILIDRTGRFYLNERELLNTEPATLKSAVHRVADGRADLPVMIKADGAAPYQAVITAMDVLSQLGLTRMSFVATRTTETQ
jgi:biopolymer transport protein ExbD